jgi:AAHS family 4-hydroxybenzoate transporter-like MFS transporter
MRLLDRFGYISVPVCYACVIPIIVCLGIPGISPAVLIMLTASAGFCFMGVQFGNISTEGNIYPTYIRSWGVGSNFAAGRVGGALGPLLGGIAFGAHLPLSTLFLCAAVPAAVGLAASAFIVPLYARRLEALRSQGEAPIAAAALHG